jgi:hypothetical protein
VIVRSPITARTRLGVGQGNSIAAPIAAWAVNDPSVATTTPKTSFFSP